jgi:hypothetical protein
MEYVSIAVTLWTLFRRFLVRITTVTLLGLRNFVVFLYPSRKIPE